MTTRSRTILCMMASVAILSSACAADPPSSSNSGSSGSEDDRSDVRVDGTGPRVDGTARPDTNDDAGPGGDGVSMGDGGMSDGGEMGPSPGNIVYSTSGGGISTSDQYRLRLSVGAPTSRGTAQNQNYRIQVAPVSP